MEQNNINKTEVGQRIKNIRLSKGMTLEEFGKIFNATKGNVLKWEKGQSMPNPERLKTIAKIADISIDELLYGSFTQRLGNILAKTLNENEKYKNLNFSALYKHIQKQTVNTELSNMEIELFVKSYLDDWVTKEQEKGITLSREDCELLVDRFNTVNIIVQKHLEEMKHTNVDKKAPLTEKELKSLETLREIVNDLKNHLEYYDNIEKYH